MHRDEALSRHERAELAQLALAADERRRLGGEVARWRAGHERGRRQRRAVAQHVGLQLAQRRAGLEAELLDHDPAPVAVGVERLRLPSAAVQRQHQEGSGPLAQRVPADERLQLAHDLGMAAEGQIGLDALLQGDQPQLVQPRDLVLGERRIGEVGEGLPPPHAERGTERLRRPRRLAPAERLLAVVQRPLEPLHVDVVAPDAQHVAARSREQRPLVVGRALAVQLPAQL